MSPPGKVRASTRVAARRVPPASADLSVASLQAIPPLLREAGVEPAAVLERVALDMRAFADSGRRLPFEQVGLLLDECAAATGCPHFGLLFGIRSGAAATGIAGVLLGHAESVHAALRLFITHVHLHDRGGVAALIPQGTAEIEFAYVIHHPNTPGTPQILDASIAIACSVMRRLCGPQWAPSAVTLAHVRPQAAGPFRTFFRAPITFDSPRSALVFPARHLDQPVAGADPNERARLLALAAELDANRPDSLTERTVRVLSRMIIAMPPTSDKVADVMGMQPRRLRERLEAEGSSVKQLLEGVRCELARQLLEETRMSIGDIATTLHYSRPGAFSRAFRGWTGRSPRQWRSTARQGRGRVHPQ